MVDGPTRDGKTLELSLNGGSTQTITFNAIDSMVDSINASISGGMAYLSIADPSYFIFRSNIREAPGSVQIVGGTILASIDQMPRLITEKSEDSLIATVLNDDLDDPVEFEDLDGALQDYYALSTVDLVGNESLKTEFRQAIFFTGPVCVLEGIVTDLQGVRQVDEIVRSKIVLLPQNSSIKSSITKTWVETLTGTDGRFSLPLLQGAVVKFEIPSLGFSRNIKVPETSYEFVTDMLIDLEYQYPLD